MMAQSRKRQNRQKQGQISTTEVAAQHSTATRIPALRHKSREVELPADLEDSTEDAPDTVYDTIERLLDEEIAADQAKEAEDAGQDVGQSSGL